MKELKCNRCHGYLGEMELGKIKKGAILLCTECYDRYKMLEDLKNFEKNSGKNDMPEFFKGIFDKK